MFLSTDNYLAKDNLRYTRYSFGNGAVGNWLITPDSQQLSFAGRQFLACPESDGSYTVGLSSDDSSPEEKDCSRIDIRAIAESNPASCVYSDEY